MAMKYTIPIRILEKRYPSRNPVWNNFLNEIKMEKYGHTGIIRGTQAEWIAYRDSKLSEFNADYDGTNLIFSNDRDRILFLLRWS